MGKQKRVPAALHSELTEYSSLLRALRTSNTLDVTTHLTKHHKSLESVDDDIGDWDDIDLDNEELESQNTSPVAGPSTLPEPEAKPQKRTTKRKRDTWTRWPLLAEDVPVPEWSLEDEVALLASLALKHQHSPLLAELEEQQEPDLGSEEALELDSDPEPDVDAENPVYIPYVTLSASNFLSSVLARVAAHTPLRPPSMQNRIGPIGWKTVLEVLASSTDVDAKCVCALYLCIYEQ